MIGSLHTCRTFSNSSSRRLKVLSSRHRNSHEAKKVKAIKGKVVYNHIPKHAVENWRSGEYLMISVLNTVCGQSVDKQ